MPNRISEEYREEVSVKLIEALERGTAPWQRPWTIENMPFNASTGKYYQGMNSILLSIEGGRLSRNGGQGDPRWVTRKQAEKKGWSVKNGAKPVEINVFVANRPKKNGGFPSKRIKYIQSEAEKKQNGRPFRLIFDIYHASQIKGISDFVGLNADLKTKRETVLNNRVIDKIIFNASARVYEGGSKAYFSKCDDIIRVPSKEYFNDTESYYATLLHELAHWTGHRSRLNRTGSYAHEELVAEIASMFLTAEFGIAQTQEHFEQHAAYVNSWSRLLRHDPNEIFVAAKEARKAANYILMFKEKDEVKLAC